MARPSKNRGSAGYYRKDHVRELAMKLIAHHRYSTGIKINAHIAINRSITQENLWQPTHHYTSIPLTPLTDQIVIDTNKPSKNNEPSPPAKSATEAWSITHALTTTAERQHLANLLNTSPEEILINAETINDIKHIDTRISSALHLRWAIYLEIHKRLSQLQNAKEHDKQRGYITGDKWGQAAIATRGTGLCTTCVKRPPMDDKHKRCHYCYYIDKISTYKLSRQLTAAQQPITLG